MKAKSKSIKNKPKPTEAPAEGMKWVQNLMTQEWIQIEIDTPYSCDPSLERFWSM